MKKFKEKNIYIHGKEFFVIKIRNNKKSRFGSFSCFEQAKQYKICLEKVNWRATPVPSKYLDPFIFIQKHGKKYQIFNKIHYGVYNTIEEAMDTRDKLVANHWNRNILTIHATKSNTNYEYIYEYKNRYRVTKLINGKQKAFGVYDSLEKAIWYRDFFKKHNWNTKYIKYEKPHNTDSAMKYITFHNNRYEISKTIDGHQRYFGGSKNLDEAKKKRDWLQEHNWQEV